MEGYIMVSNLYVDEELFNFINTKALQGSGLTKDKFWDEFSELIHDLTPQNKNLLADREKVL